MLQLLHSLMPFPQPSVPWIQVLSPTFTQNFTSAAKTQIVNTAVQNLAIIPLSDGNRSPNEQFSLFHPSLAQPLPGLSPRIQWRTPNIFRERSQSSEPLSSLDGSAAQTFSVARFGSRRHLVERATPTKKSPTTKCRTQTSSCSPQPPTEKHHCNRQTVEWPLCQANGQNHRLFGSPRHDPGGTSAAHFCALPPAGSERVGSIDLKKDFDQPCPLSTPCRDSRSPSSSHPPYILKRHTTSQADIHPCEKNFPARFLFKSFRSERGCRRDVKRRCFQKWIMAQTVVIGVRL